jgi:hypothetical protein
MTTTRDAKTSAHGVSPSHAFFRNFFLCELLVVPNGRAFPFKLMAGLSTPFSTGVIALSIRPLK